MNKTFEQLTACKLYLNTKITFMCIDIHVILEKML